MTWWLCSRVWVFLDFKKPTNDRPTDRQVWSEWRRSRYQLGLGPAWLPTWPRLTRFERSQVATQVLFFRGFLNIVFKLRLSRLRLAGWKLVYRYISNTAWRSCVEKFVPLRLLLFGAFWPNTNSFAFWLIYLLLDTPKQHLAVASICAYLCPRTFKAAEKWAEECLRRKVLF